MTKKGNDISDLTNKAIEASIAFEVLMDSTDFDSWLETDTCDQLKQQGQDITPFKNFEKNKSELKRICEQMMQKGDNVLCNSEDKSALEKYFIYQLFDAKLKRLNARISSDKKREERYYKDSRLSLNIALNNLQDSGSDNEFWQIFFYNDLSICHAGLENSSISRGCAEEARKIIEGKNSYKHFDKKLNPDTKVAFEKDEFVSSRLYDLYTVTIFNQALAERRSHREEEAEGNFKKIIKYADQPVRVENCLLNFNFYSAIVNLSDLYIDQGRGKEAIELVNRAIKSLDEDDIRYWDAYLYKITALIDQCEYSEAEELLFDKFIKREGSSFTLYERHRVTSAGFTGLNHYVRCQIERVKNTLKLSEGDKKSNLTEVKNIIDENIAIIIARKQKATEVKAYKHLNDIYEIWHNYKDGIKNLIKLFSKNEVDDLAKFVEDEKREFWINDCDDLNVLESFVKTICNINVEGEKYTELLKTLREKIKKECEDKGQLSQAERLARIIDEFLGEAAKLKYNKNVFEKGLSREDIRKRLDRNEKEFDSVLFNRTEMRSKDNLVEVIVLRRWNSFSPGLFTGYTGSLGGGYFLRINKPSENGEEKVHNIVIDPGYNFLQNFRGEGFRIEDIDIIIITHSHLDHCAELLPIMDLIFQFNKRYEKYHEEQKRDKKRVSLCLSQGAYNKFLNYTMDTDWQKQLKDVILIENLPKRRWNLCDGLTISSIPTPHMDLGGVKATGLKIEVGGIGGNKEEFKDLRLGFTSDTPWYKEIKQDFEECDLLCIHLGSIKYQEIGYTDERYVEGEKREIADSKGAYEEIYAKSNHLLFYGTKNVVDSYSRGKDNLIIVGEFGEELKYGLRTELCERLSDESCACLPCDIGLYIAIKKNGTKKIRCNFCEEFVGPEEIRTFSYGREDAIHYICNTCNKTLSDLQKQAIIEHRLTRH